MQDWGRCLAALDLLQVLIIIVLLLLLLLLLLLSLFLRCCSHMHS